MFVTSNFHDSIVEGCALVTPRQMFRTLGQILNDFSGELLDAFGYTLGIILELLLSVLEGSSWVLGDLRGVLRRGFGVVLPDLWESWGGLGRVFREFRGF